MIAAGHLHNHVHNGSQETTAMIQYSVFYPNLAGKRFDIDYYCNRHMPMVLEKLGAACKGAVVETGISGVEPGSEATYIAIGRLYFDSVESYRAAFTPHVAVFRADIPNYTDITPARQISEVKLQIGPG
jgi:uncharacterized protein (TIGR02118 family)